jgi:multidrug efflux system membrane fusion protein
MCNPSVLTLRRSARGARLVAATCASLIAGTGCAAKPAARPPRAAIAVTVVRVRRASVPYEVTATGMVTPMQTAAVVPQVDGIITDVTFAEGQDVTKGEVLFRIEPRPYQAAYDQAVAMLARDRATAGYARGEAARYDTLAQSRSVTQEQDDQARATAASAVATVDADQAALATAKFNLDNTTIRAPIAGRTGSLLVHIGNVIHAAGGTPLVVINQVRPTMVRFAVPASALPKILHYGAHGGLPVTVMSTDAAAAAAAADTTTPMDAPTGAVPTPAPASTRPVAPDPERTGTLSFIDNAIDTTTLTVQLKATFANKGGTLWAGQSVATSLRLFIEDSVLVVPTGAVVIGQTGTYVWVVDSSNTAQERPVVVERAAGDMSVITSGLTDGDRVVTSGQSRLTTGASITLGGRDSTGGGRRGGRGGRSGSGGRSGRGGRGTSQGPATP